MSDLSERDLSRIPDAELTAEEREELERRMDEFLQRLHARHGRRGAQKAEGKRIQRWDPVAIARRH